MSEKSLGRAGALIALVAAAAAGCNETAVAPSDAGARMDAAPSDSRPTGSGGRDAGRHPSPSDAPAPSGSPTVEVLDAGREPPDDGMPILDGSVPVRPVDASTGSDVPRVDAGVRDARAPVQTPRAEAGGPLATPLDAGLDGGPIDGGLDSGSRLDASSPIGWLPPAELDLAAMNDDPGFFRWYGSATGDGSLGVPVASADFDGDGHVDLAMSSFQASPLDRAGAGQVTVVFGEGGFRGALDLTLAAVPVLTIIGDGPKEGTGDQLGVGDVNGDGVTDLLLCRQNFRAANPDRVGAGALSIVLGGSSLRALAESTAVLDLRAPPADVPIVTLVGAAALDRLGIWVSTGDLTGDGIADVAVGADQTDRDSEQDAGAVYVLRGGPHLGQAASVDLASFGSAPFEGHLTKLIPPPSSAAYHLGATLHVGDLDRNGRAELVAAAALVRSGASYLADGAPTGSAVYNAGAPPGGRAYVIWDDNFAGDSWEPGRVIDLAAPPGPVTALLSDTSDLVVNRRLGEELLAGGDYDGDGRPDLFVGDMIANAPDRSNTGVGFVIYDAAQLRAFAEVNVLAPPPGVALTTLVGAVPGAIATDTARHGDFDGDGVFDLAVASPNASPDGRIQAGTVHVLWGNTRRWPSVVDFASLPSADLVQVTVVWGAAGGNGTDSGDMLSYSAEVADVDGDGLDDLIANEMGGNGVEAGSTDSGNLLVLSGALLARGRPDCRGVQGGSARIDACGVCSRPGRETSCVSFAADVLPLFTSACPSCHGASAGLGLFSYSQLMSGSSLHGPVVIPGDPERSVLWQKLNGLAPFGDRMPPPPDPALPASDIDTIAEWIRNGARDN